MKAPPFPQHSSINFNVILKTSGKFLNFIKNVIQLCHGMYIIYKLKENINYIYKIYFILCTTVVFKQGGLYDTCCILFWQGLSWSAVCDFGHHT